MFSYSNSLYAFQGNQLLTGLLKIKKYLTPKKWYTSPLISSSGSPLEWSWDGFDEWCLCLTLFCLSWWLTSTAATSPLQRHPLGSDRANTRSDTCLKRQWKDHTEDVSRAQMRPTHQARNKQHLSSEMNGFRAAAGTIISVLGRYKAWRVWIYGS